MTTANFPKSTYEAAIRHLRRWIEGSTDLYSHLTDAGFDKNQHHHTTLQTALIFEYLGVL